MQINRIRVAAHEGMPDDWIALDKLEHFFSCAIIVIASYGLICRWPSLHPHRLVLSFCIGIIAGTAKELGDELQLWPGEPSWRDFAADLLGCITASAALVFWEQRSPKEQRYIDLELGVVYGNPIKRQWRKALNTAKDAFAKAKEVFP
ncbi:hypothetical protein CEUSTIGMA_g1401.t1 [Chlamydomonas eustigma]|uniref:VanZ-like domain-containing protein n=1 Tax=Chlamydomonas eustigma TaxID=1157962 RepID=A0A250WT26_9CHLO|nr:hypothetical protein CEUSTIGMA_g1401.t1 [Chlamydomonas eustigma]|eukprot:GAX73951.1 hypothetical protein CEUSTIGMA_g1401.t1 [Chlamydomonas eustigma]